MRPFKVGQILVCSEDTIGVIQAVHKREGDLPYFYSVEFSDDNINNGYHNAYWEEYDVEQWYWNYLDLKDQINESQTKSNHT